MKKLITSLFIFFLFAFSVSAQDFTEHYTTSTVAKNSAQTSLRMIIHERGGYIDTLYTINFQNAQSVNIIDWQEIVFYEHEQVCEFLKLAEEALGYTSAQSASTIINMYQIYMGNDEGSAAISIRNGLFYLSHTDIHKFIDRSGCDK